MLLIKHDLFLSDPFQFIIFYHPTIQSYWQHCTVNC